MQEKVNKKKAKAFNQKVVRGDYSIESKYEEAEKNVVW